MVGRESKTEAEVAAMAILMESLRMEAFESQAQVGILRIALQQSEAKASESEAKAIFLCTALKESEGKVERYMASEIDAQVEKFNTALDIHVYHQKRALELSQGQAPN